MTSNANELIEQIYDGIVEASGFDQAIGLLGRHLGADASLAFAYSDQGPQLWSLHGIEPSVFAAYEAHYHHFDLYKDALKALGALRPGFLFTDQTLVTPQAMRRSPLVQELLLPNGLGPLLGGPAHVGTSGSLVELAFYRAPGAQPFDRAQVQLLRAIMPHLGRACRLRMNIGEKALLHAWTETFLDELSWGVVLLDEAGRIVLENREASRILRSADGLCRRAGRLHATHADDDRQLAATLGDPSCGTARGGDLSIRRPSGRPPYLVTVVPTPRRDASRAGEPEARTAVHMTDPLVSPRRDHRRLVAMFGLSTAECAVALELTRGLSLAHIAERQGVALSTVRSQLLALFAKTGTNRQSHLVSLCLRALSLPGRDLP